MTFAPWCSYGNRLPSDKQTGVCYSFVDFLFKGEVKAVLT